jgi:putative endonuclease
MKLDFWRRLREGKATAARLSHLELGAWGEQMAAAHLARNGYRLVATNFVAPLGYSRNDRPITGEIDIVAYDESVRPFVLAFIEVKTRTSAEFAAPEAAVDLRKQRQIVRTAPIYRRLMKVENEAYRYDVVSIVIAPQNEPVIVVRRGYFSEQMFARKHWRRGEDFF